MFFPCPAIYRSVDKKQACKRNETSLSIEVDGLWRKGTTKREPARVRTLHFTGCPRMSEMLNTFPHQKSRDQIHIFSQSTKDSMQSMVLPFCVLVSNVFVSHNFMNKTT